MSDKHPDNEFTQLIAQQRKRVRSGANSTPAVRKALLKRLKTCIQENQDELLAALAEDLGKPPAESYASETGFVIQEINHAVRRVGRWMGPKKVLTPLIAQPGKSWYTREPMGSVLVLAPWNYPIQLSLAPAVAAICAGNSVVIKPSELAPASAAALERLINKGFSPEELKVVCGDAQTSADLCSAGFDHIFFTGGHSVGKKVYAAAAKNMTPVTMELGGKNPCIVEADATLHSAARRITQAKFFNAGQTCLAPDTVLVHRDVSDEFITELRSSLQDFFGDNPRESVDYGRIIHKQHFTRLVNMLEDAEIIHGGDFDEKKLYISPTLVANPRASSSILIDEIFGPILPILRYSNTVELFAILEGFATPLANYVFTSNKELLRKLNHSSPAGAIVENECMYHVVNPRLPFGGVGTSGFGSYHGEHGFLTLSRPVAHFRRPKGFGLSFTSPPYSEKIVRFIRWFMSK